MSRYKGPPKTFLLRFEDRPGLEVVMRSLSIGKMLDLAELADVYKDGKATKAQAADLFALFAERVVSWNIDDDNDEPVPATLDGAMSLDPALFLEIFEGWFNGMTQAPKVSPEPSSGGPLPAEAASLPMEPLSVVRAS